jgi:hypothetical protein
MRSELFSDAELRNKSIDALKRRLRNKLAGYRLVFKDIKVGNLLYRGVPWHDHPTKIDEVSYPPADRVKINRANRVGRPMFYCSVAAAAVFYELRAKQGDRIALSQWEIAEPLWMHNLGYHEAALAKLGAPDIAMRAGIYDLIPNETSKNSKLRRLLSLAFTEDIPVGREYRYKQSVAINELLFDKADPIPPRPGGPNSVRVAGTVYPTMQMRGAADNVAISPEFVDSSLRIKSVRHVLVEDADEARLSYTLLTIAYAGAFSGRDILWQSALAPEHERRSRIALEGNVWVLRDGLDRVYDRHAAGECPADPRR